MTRRTGFTPRASRDVELASERYAQQRPSLRDDFLEEIERALATVHAAPEGAPVVFRQMRRVLLRRFPYSIYYRVTADMIEVRACLHQRRNVDRLLRSR